MTQAGRSVRFDAGRPHQPAKHGSARFHALPSGLGDESIETRRLRMPLRVSLVTLAIGDANFDSEFAAAEARNGEVSRSTTNLSSAADGLPVWVIGAPCLSSPWLPWQLVHSQNSSCNEHGAGSDKHIVSVERRSFSKSWRDLDSYELFSGAIDVTARGAIPVPRADIASTARAREDDDFIPCGVRRHYAIG